MFLNKAILLKISMLICFVSHTLNYENVVQVCNFFCYTKALAQSFVAFKRARAVLQRTGYWVRTFFRGQVYSVKVSSVWYSALWKQTLSNRRSMETMTEISSFIRDCMACKTKISVTTLSKSTIQHNDHITMLTQEILTKTSANM